MKSIKNILITGGAGFIGSALIRSLVRNSEYKVINIDKLTYSGSLESLKSIKNRKNYIFEKLDICDSINLQRVINDSKPDLVIHLAAESHVDRSIDEPIDFIQTNVIGTFNVLEGVRIYYQSLKGLKKDNFRFLHVSTDEVYGDLKNTNNFFSEETRYDPSSPYSASKASSDHLVRAWHRTYNLPVLITNCSNNYGPYQFPEKLIPHMILTAITLKPLPVYGDGKQIRDWLYVDDHVSALMIVALQGKIGETYNIGGNNEIKNIEVVQQICSILDELLPINNSEFSSYSELITYVEDRPGHDVRYAIDSSKINKSLGWKPNENFESGIRKTIMWYLKNHAWLKSIQNDNYKLVRLGKSK